MKKQKKKFTPTRDLVALETTLKEKKTTEHGIVYTENQVSDNYWKLGSNNSEFYKDGDFIVDIVNFTDLLVVKCETR